MATPTPTSLDEYVCLSSFNGQSVAWDATNRIPTIQGAPGSGLNQLWLHSFGSHLTVTRLKDNVLYAAMNGKVFAVNATTGETLWSVYPEQKICSEEGNNYLSLILARDEPCLYYSQAGHIVKMNQNDGSIVWHELTDKYSTHYPVNIVEAENSIIVGIWGHLFSYDKKTGQHLWKNGLEGYGYAAISMGVRGNVLLIATHGYLAAVSISDGTIISYRNLRGTGFNTVALTLDPFNHSHMYVATGGQLRCMAYENGAFTKIWKSRLPGMGSAVAHSIYLDCSSNSVKSVILGMAGAVCCVDANKGEMLWKNEMKGAGGAQFVCLNDFNDETLIAACGCKMLGINKITGETDWGATLKGLVAPFTLSTKRQSTDFNSTTLQPFLEHVEFLKRQQAAEPGARVAAKGVEAVFKVAFNF